MATEKLWGYRADGSARLFLVAEGESLPDGWSPDISIIADPAKRTGEAVSAAAGPSVHTPVLASDEAAAAVRADAREKAERDALIPRYDEENNLVPIAKKRIGR